MVLMCQGEVVVDTPFAVKVDEIMNDIRKYIINFCMTFPEVYEDYPFKDKTWTLMRHKNNNKVFAWIFQRQDNIWINVKCDPEWIDFWRNAYKSVVPGYHLNKEHWNSIIMDGNVPDKDVRRMIGESYDLTRGKRR